MYTYVAQTFLTEKKVCAIFISKPKICNSFLLNKDKYSEFTKGENLCLKESYKMGKKVKNVFVLVAMLCLFIGNLNVFAAEQPFIEGPHSKIEIVATTDNLDNVLSSPALSACEMGIGAADNGVQVTFVTTATQAANEIGVKNVVFQEKTWYGWKDIPASNYYTNNSDHYIGSVTYTAATKGTTYRVKCTHYAKFGSTELTLDNTSSELTYN